MAEHADDAMKTAAEAIRALRHIPKDETAIEARARACAAIAAQKELEAAARKTMTDAITAKRKNGNGNGAKSTEVVATDLSEQLLEDLLTGLARGLMPVLRERIAEAVTPLLARLDALEKHKGLAPLAVRLAEIEAAALTDGDIWREGATYRKNALVTHNGHLWISKRETNRRPPGDDWRLTHHNAKAHR